MSNIKWNKVKGLYSARVNLGVKDRNGRAAGVILYVWERPLTGMFEIGWQPMRDEDNHGPPWGSPYIYPKLHKAKEAAEAKISRVRWAACHYD